MELIRVSAQEFDSIVSYPYHEFNSANFNDVNKKNCDEVFYFLFKEKKYRLALIGGRNQREFSSPFSAPFGGFSLLENGKNVLKYIEQAIILLEDWCISAGLEGVSITLPPPIYESTFVSKQLNVFYRSGYQIESIDLNYHFCNADIEPNYSDRIHASARKALKRSIDSNLTFYKCTTREDLVVAYDVIYRNRKAKNFPLKMTFDDIEKTHIKKDFFLVANENGISVAAAIVYFVGSDVVQVVYWGDDPIYSSLRPMNFLSSRIFQYYHSQGVQYTDIGPSTEDSMPNYGLCDFKESIGCHVSSKIRLKKQL